MMEKTIAQRGSLTSRQWYSLQGTLMRAFHVVNRRGKSLAIGAVGAGRDPGFVMLRTKRAENDLDLIRAIESLTGMTVRRHYWQKGAKGHAVVLGIVTPEVRHAA